MNSSSGEYQWAETSQSVWRSPHGLGNTIFYILSMSVTARTALGFANVAARISWSAEQWSVAGYGLRCWWANRDGIPALKDASCALTDSYVAEILTLDEWIDDAIETELTRSCVSLAF